MKKILVFLGGIFLFLIVIVVGLGIYMGVQLGPADEEARVYARNSILAISSEWDADEVFARASEELLATLDEGEVIQLMRQGARAVGDLTKLGEVECATNISTHTKTGKIVQSECTANAEHQRGSVDYTVNVMKRDESWSTTGFHFNVVEMSEGATEI